MESELIPPNKVEADSKVDKLGDGIRVPDTLLSPPTSRSNSPVTDMKFDKIAENEDSDSSEDELVLNDEDYELQKKKEDKDNKDCEEKLVELNQTDRNVRYQQLMHLLEKSSIYTGFLLEKIKSEEKAKSEFKTNSIDESASSSQQNTRKKGGRNSKRKKAAVSDVIDKQDLIKRQRINEEGDCASGSSSQEQSEKSEDSLKQLQPKLVSGAVLREYQLYGVNWISTLYDNGMNGILADEMGLGKTIQSIGLLAKLIELGGCGPFLVVAPLSTISNWRREFNMFAPEIPTVLFHGSKTERPKLYKDMKESVVHVGNIKQKVFPVLITSYEMVMLEYNFLKRFEWKFLIVDEGHRLKNLNCRLIKHLKGLNSANRLLLTGTPLQNNLSELWSLLNFILPDIFDDLDSFQMWFDFSALEEDGDGAKEKIIESEKQGQVLRKLHQILCPFLLRRVKTDVELCIPPKMEVHVYASMTALQQEYYKAILDRRIFSMLCEKKEEELEKSGKGLRKRKRIDYNEDAKDVKGEDGYVDISKWSCVKPDIYDEFDGTKSLTRLNRSDVTSSLKMTWVQLKKCSNHPYLLKYPCDEQGYAQITDEILTCSGKMLLLHRMLPEIIDRGHKVLIFSTMTKLLDIVEDYLSLYSWKSSRLDGSMNFVDRDENIQRFTNDPDYKIFLLSTRAGGLGLNLMAADTVIIFDSDWNPQCDLQAQDRAHRIGQRNKVMVYRFLTKNTMDQKIVERGISKRFLEKMVIHKGKFKTVDSGGSDHITEDDLAELFDCDALKALKSDYQPEDILSDADLSALLDRDSPLPPSKAYTVVENVETSAY